MKNQKPRERTNSRFETWKPDNLEAFQLDRQNPRRRDFMQVKQSEGKQGN